MRSPGKPTRFCPRLPTPQLLRSVAPRQSASTAAALVRARNRGDRFLAAIAVMVLGAACATPPQRTDVSVTQPAPAASAAASTDLHGQWKLKAYGPPEQPLEPPASAEVTAAFSGDRVSGRAACNHYDGEYTVEAGRLSIAQIVRTAAACEPKHLMILDDVYINALQTATAYTVAGDTLRIEYPGGVLHLTR